MAGGVVSPSSTAGYRIIGDITLTDKQREALRVIRNNKYTLLSGGSRSGKTFVSCLSIISRAAAKPSRHAIVRFHFNDVKRSIGMDTLPKLFGLMPHVSATLNKSDWYYRLSNGSEIWLCGLDDKDRADKILGNEYSTIYFNEASQISYDAYQTALSRLAENAGLNNKIIVDCNPPEKTHWLYALYVMHKQPSNRNLPIPNDNLYGYLDVNPIDNIANLPEGYIDDVLLGLDDRKRARFLEGRWLDRREGALWSIDTITSTRLASAPKLVRVVVAIDPAVTANEDSDETGIVVAGIDSSDHVYVLEDLSVKASPLQWGRIAIDAYNRHHADRIVAEVNQGGDLVEANLRSIDKLIPYEQVRATRGKILRAEPIAALYEQGRVHHIGIYPDLELQMTEFNPQSEDSPDRLDALVWACTYLTASRAPRATPIAVTGGGLKW